jgi:hypothetical protein
MIVVSMSGGPDRQRRPIISCAITVSDGDKLWHLSSPPATYEADFSVD